MDNRELRKFLTKKNQILTGSYLLKNRYKKNIDRESYMIQNMIYNKALIFHANGIAAALGVSFFSLLPVIFLHQINSEKKSNNTNLEIDNTDANPKIKSDDWELATKEELQSGEFEVG